MSLNDSEFNINPNDPYFKAVKAVFDNWTALQLAVTHNFGGSNSKETAEWFLNATYQWIVDNNDLEDIELEDFLMDTMNNEFNTILDDGSCLEISRQLLKYSNLYCSGKIVELNDEISKRFAKKVNSIQSSQKVKNAENADLSSSEEDSGEEDEDEAMEQEATTAKPKNQMTEEETENFEKLEEGWTMVTKTGKHVTK